MSTTPSSPATEETILQKRDRLYREIEERYEQSRAIENDVARERFMAGLRALAAAKAWLEVERWEEDGCTVEVALEVTTSWGDVHPLMGCFELKDYHDAFDTDTPGIDGVAHVGISHDDGNLSIRARFAHPTAATSLKRLLAEIGLPLKSGHLKDELANMLRNAARKEAEIAAVEAPLS